MAALSTILAIGGLAASAAGTAAGAVQQRRAQKDARREAEELGEVQRRRESELASRKASDDAARAQRMARERQRMKGISTGFRETILTSPLGLPNGGIQYGGKTLLGA